MSEAYRKRVARGTTAVLAYLQAQFPGYVVKILERSSDDSARSARTFEVQSGKERYLARVTDEVLDLDTEGVSGLLQKFSVARALRQVGSREALLVKTDEISVE